jgi:hypothetical protein
MSTPSHAVLVLSLNTEQAQIDMLHYLHCPDQTLVPLLLQILQKSHSEWRTIRKSPLGITCFRIHATEEVRDEHGGIVIDENNMNFASLISGTLPPLYTCSKHSIFTGHDTTQFTRIASLCEKVWNITARNEPNTLSANT